MSRVSRTFISLLLASSTLSAAHAQTTDAEPTLDETAPADENVIMVTGTRATGQQAADSASPIRLLGAEELSRVGQPNLNQALTQLVPSFSAQTQGTDMSNFSLSARLRGLNPNHTLVLVNGKRRHGSAILQVIAGPFQGSAAPSIDLIPPDAVQRIEVFQEGAAAVYGSDAIAGVVNIILKSNDQGGTAKVTGGQYYDSEGETLSVSGNLGFAIGESGFLNLTLFHRRNGHTFQGDGQTSVRDINGNLATNIPAAFVPIYDALDLKDINGGQAKSDLNVAFYNAGYDFGDFEFYSFGNVARREGEAYQGYRVPNRICTSSSNPATCFADTGTTGMVPLQKVVQDQYSITGGLRGDIGGWEWDLSSTYGSDGNDIFTIESANRSLFIDTGFTPTDFYNGSFSLTQWTNTLDIQHDVEIGLAEPLTIAFGAEYREETYGISPGDYGSRYKEGGQSFPGYSLTDAGDYSRDSKSAYLNFITNPVEGWVVDIAGRYEDYSDFGDTVIGKLTTRYDFTDEIALRGTVSTGFRAPTMGESYYSATNVAPTSASVQLPPNSAAAALLGFSPLKPEKSKNYSAGVVLRPADRLVVSLDGYYITIKDRIAGTSAIRGLVNNVPQTNLINGIPAYDAVMAAIAARGTVIDNVPTVSVQTFTNGIDTRTWGLDFSARYPVDLTFGELDLSLNANYNETKVTENRLGSALFTPQAESYLETAQPKYKATLGILFTKDAFSINLRQSYQGSSTVLVFPAISGYGPYEGVVKATPLTDLELGYEFTDWMKFSLGATNLFNKKPEIPELLPVAVASGTSPYVNGTTTINSRYGHGSYGSNGGYYYARLDFNF
ncbi:TonB-dependent receptor plug domain-containing protein [Altererythrobacter sp. Root672]|uniref:TonB-dependent receptor plug domain-containing protein n=1 Tax=Altererythrobacter sp. Root672 TaxID=1736584 RepID=UPI000701DE04|nr:TonB-dependent receptor [Altererythrobacter sp. Root672]KRA82679.1 TonB-dependent receptor [Altererythrobacter sp. Root672]